MGYIMIGVISSIAEDRSGCYFEPKDGEQIKFRIGETVSIDRKKARRSDAQNRFWWAYLTWCIERGGLKQLGHYSVDALHEDIKAWIMSEHSMQFREEFSTAELNKPEFAAFFSIVDMELMGQFFCIDTSRFHADYEAFKEWQQYNESGTFKEWMSAAA